VQSFRASALLIALALLFTVLREDERPAYAVIEQVYTLPYFDSSYITCPWGPYENCGLEGQHDGTDYSVGSNTTGGENVVAALSGKAWLFSHFDPFNNNLGCGYYIIIDHTNGHKSRYCHLSDRIVANGQDVARGQVIGHEGSSGATAVNLHFDSRVNASPGNCCSGTSVDPYGGPDSPGTYLWASHPPTTAGWQPPASWQDWGPVYAATGTDLATAVSHDNSLPGHTAAARVNSIGQKFEWRQWAPGWSNWTDISAGISFNGKIGISNHENQIHVVGVSNGDMRYRKRVSGSWNSWTNLGHPTAPGGGIFDGPVAVSYSGIRIVVAGVVQGNVWVRLSYNGVWGSWVSLAGGNSLGESIAIVTRPNGIYSIVAFRPYDHLVFMRCSTNYATWTGWMSLGGMLGDSLAVDNAVATNCGTGSSYPGVHVVGFSAYHTMIRCWEPYCQLAAWEDLGAMFGGPVAISNTGGVVSIVNRTANEMMHRYRAY